MFEKLQVERAREREREREKVRGRKRDRLAARTLKHAAYNRN